MNAGSAFRILAVDDNEEILRLVEKILLLEGYEVLKAATGAAAIERARAERPDLIILDLMLPDLDGLEVCRALRRDSSTARTMIVMLTARGSPDHRIRGFDSGADDYIEKPFHREEFLARIRAALRLKTLHDKLEERNRQLIESQQALVLREKMATVGLLAAGLAHEFNNIMSGIAGYAQMAKKDPTHLPELVEVALAQGKRATEITDALRTFIRPQEIHFLPVPLSDVLDQVTCLVRKELERRGIEFIARVPRDLPPLRAVPGQLQQILLNLVLNAIHATPQGGRIEVSARPNGNKVELLVSDTGCGIAAKHLDRIFDPFFTTKGSLGGGNAPGTGLGLTVVYNLVRAHGATIAVSSVQGSGTTFTISMPQASFSSAPAKARSSRVLLLADDASTEGLVGQAMGEGELSIARSYEAARGLLAGGDFAAVLIDGDLAAAEDPVAFLAWLRRAASEALIAVFSSNVGEAGFSHLADRHLLKPFAPEVLGDILAEASSGLPAPRHGGLSSLCEQAPGTAWSKSG